MKRIILLLAAALLCSSQFAMAVTEEEVNAAPASNIPSTLYGRIPGLWVSQNGGEPGNDAATLNIRGIATYNNTTIPVYVDGFQINPEYFYYMSASEIESICVLKDAAELAPFGMKGANGVIWVTTKRGSAGKIKVDVNLKSGVAQPTAIYKGLGTDEFSALYNEAYSNDNGGVWSPFYTDEQISGMPDVDWYDHVMRSFAPYEQGDITISGGDDVAKYFVAFDYMNQRGLYNIPVNDTLANASSSRFNLMANLDVKLSSWMDARIDISGRVEDKTRPNYGTSSLWADLAKYPNSIYPVKNVDGSWTGTPVYNNNPVASINALGRHSMHERTFDFTLTLRQHLDALLEGLYFSEAVSLSSWTMDEAWNSKTYSRFYNGVQQTTDNDSPYSRYENSGSNQWNWKHYTGTVGYDTTFGDSDIDAYVNVLYNQYGTDVSTNGDAGAMINYKHMNVAGAFNYTYAKRYMASLTFACSGSDNYRKGNRWGIYPAVSLGWVAIDGSNAGSVFDFLKVKTAFGINGWDPTGEKRYLWESYFDHSGGVNTGNGNPNWKSGFSSLYEANPDIFAETSKKIDLGLSSEMFSNRLSVDLDLFYEKRDGIVTQEWTIPAAAGIENPAYKNIGKVSNKGFDLSLAWKDRVGDFSYGISGIASYASNRIDNMAEIITIPSQARTGNSIGSVFGYHADGFYSPDDFDAEGNLKSSLPAVTLSLVQPGDIKYSDMNDDNVIDDQDMTLIGNSMLPKMNYSFCLNLAYRNFDFSALFQGTLGRDINLLDIQQMVAFRDNSTAYPVARGRWAYYPEQGIDTRAMATYPRLSLLNNNNNYQNSTLWMRDGDFLKLRNIQIGYTLPARVASALKLERARIYFCGLNLLTISDFTDEFDIDPEVLSGYPATKSYNLGLSLTF